MDQRCQSLDVSSERRESTARVEERWVEHSMGRCTARPIPSPRHCLTHSALLLGVAPPPPPPPPPSFPSSHLLAPGAMGLPSLPCKGRGLLLPLLLSTAAVLALLGYFLLSLLSRSFLHWSSSSIPWSGSTTPPVLRGSVSPDSVPQSPRYFSTQRVVLCGLLRDKEEQVSFLQQSLPRLTSLFLDWAVVVVENDSSDTTREQLLAWQFSQPRHVHVLGYTESAPVSTFRTLQHDYSERRIRKMAALRNTYLSYVTDHPILSTYDLLIVMDLDLKSFLYTDGLFSTAYHLEHSPNISAVAANGLQLTGLPFTFSLLRGLTYQDPYAHEDSFNRGKSVPQLFDNWRSNFINRFPYSAPLHLVYSAFNGFTIYRMSAVRGKRYAVHYSEHGHFVLCEHVGFHRQLGDERAGGMVLNPSMMNVILDNSDGRGGDEGSNRQAMDFSADALTAMTR